MNSERIGKNRVAIRHQLADAAKVYNWKKTLELLKDHPDLINSTRPGGESLYTPLHQAAHENAPPDVIQPFRDMNMSIL